MTDSYDEICKNCGLTLGSHLGDSYYSESYKREFPKDYCPGHEGRMDWDAGPGTTFRPTGTFKLVLKRVERERKGKENENG